MFSVIPSPFFFKNNWGWGDSIPLSCPCRDITPRSFFLFFEQLLSFWVEYHWFDNDRLWCKTSTLWRHLKWLKNLCISLKKWRLLTLVSPFVSFLSCFRTIFMHSSGVYLLNWLSINIILIDRLFLDPFWFGQLLDRLGVMVWSFKLDGINCKQNTTLQGFLKVGAFSRVHHDKLNISQDGS